MNMIGNAPTGQLNVHHQYNGSQIGIGANTSSQYEYSIDGQIEPANMRSGSNPNAQNIGMIKGNTITSKSSGSGPQTQSMPKRTPHSELTSYQSEKRLKEYKQQQAQLQQQQQQQLPQVNQINANSRQQFIIEEEGAYSQRSSDDDQND